MFNFVYNVVSCRVVSCFCDVWANGLHRKTPGQPTGVISVGCHVGSVGL